MFADALRLLVAKPCHAAADLARRRRNRRLEIQRCFPFELDVELTNPTFDVVAIQLTLHRYQNDLTAQVRTDVAIGESAVAILEA